MDCSCGGWDNRSGQTQCGNTAPILTIDLLLRAARPKAPQSLPKAHPHCKLNTELMSGRRDFTVNGLDRACQLRGRATKAERALKAILDAARISYVFQSYAHDDDHLYIADFRIKRPSQGKGNKQRVYVEVDGSSHVGREAYDARRTAWLEERRNGIVVRFTNERVLTDPAGVLTEIMKFNPSIKTGSKTAQVAAGYKASSTARETT